MRKYHDKVSEAIGHNILHHVVENSTANPTDKRIVDQTMNDIFTVATPSSHSSNMDDLGYHSS